jgi:hypothetical protein
MIGLLFKKNFKYSIISTVIAMAYGASIFWGLNALGTAIQKITYPGFGWNLGMIIDGAFPFIFAMFPVIAIYIYNQVEKKVQFQPWFLY